ncbi:hypothetical protein BC832DRAFT_346014 [Gaertneriomyces semiglobifer]|nr:hypothetical protein BC832DRAFT_346014 [Gaertneriomyces semiglobifer]
MQGLPTQTKMLWGSRRNSANQVLPACSRSQRPHVGRGYADDTRITSIFQGREEYCQCVVRGSVVVLWGGLPTIHPVLSSFVADVTVIARNKGSSPATRKYPFFPTTGSVLNLWADIAQRFWTQISLSRRSTTSNGKRREEGIKRKLLVSCAGEPNAGCWCRSTISAPVQTLFGHAL